MLTYSIFYQWITSITSITIEMYVESWVGVVKLDVQCDHDLLLSPFLIESAIGWLNYWWIFFVSLSHAYDIAVESPSMSLYHFTFL